MDARIKSGHDKGSMRQPRGSGPSPLPQDVNASAARRTNGQLELVLRDLDEALQIGPIPIRERAPLDMDGNDAIRFADRVCAEVGYGALGCGLAFLCRDLRELSEVVDCIIGA